MNDDKEFTLRIILNEIDAKQFIIRNAHKYGVPRNELEHIKQQLEGLEEQLRQLEGEN